MQIEVVLRKVLRPHNVEFHCNKSDDLLGHHNNLTLLTDLHVSMQHLKKTQIDNEANHVSNTQSNQILINTTPS
ncbi:hypothetical protein, partial [Hafnia paralvei]|uniref:hypothetical protein n=1 Tax=Hafnia paralvei TaxID=546367 RepID=UPI0029D49307